MTAGGGSDRPVFPGPAELEAYMKSRRDAVDRLITLVEGGADAAELEQTMQAVQDGAQGMADRIGLRFVEPGDLMPAQLSSLSAALSRAVDDGAVLTLAGDPISAADLLARLNERSRSLMAQGFRPFDRLSLPPDDLGGLVTLVAALRIGLWVSDDDQPSHPSGDWAGTFDEAHEVAGVLSIGDQRIEPSQLPSGVRAKRCLPEGVPRLLLELGDQLASWADPAYVWQKPMFGDSWDEAGMTIGEPGILPGCIAVSVRAGEYDCCGSPMVRGQRVEWNVVTRPPWAGCAMAFHLDVPDPEPLVGVIEEIFVVRDEYVPAEEGDQFGCAGSSTNAYARTGRRAYRAVAAYPNRRWRGDLVVAVRPAQRSSI